MNGKKIILNGLIVAAAIALIAFIPSAGNLILSWLVPPRLYIVIGVAIFIVLWKILEELRKKNERNDNE